MFKSIDDLAGYNNGMTLMEWLGGIILSGGLASIFIISFFA